MLRKVLSLLDPSEKVQAAWLFALILVMAIVETAGVASIMPFIAVLADPDIMQKSEALRQVHDIGGFRTQGAFVMFLGFCVLGILVLTNLLGALSTWAVSHFTYMRTHAISRRLLAHYLARPYAFFLGRNSADMAKDILSETNTVVRNVLVGLMQIVAKGAASILILILLLAVDPVLTLVVLVVLGGAYLAIYLLAHRALADAGGRRVRATTARFKAIAEAFAGIKDTKILGREAFHTNRYEAPSRESALTSAFQENVSLLPRYALETLAYGIVIGTVLYLSANRGGIAQALPVIALYAFAGQRLMPALQMIFSNAAKMRFAAPALDHVAEELARPPEESGAGNDGARLPLEKGLEVRNLSFRYGAEQMPVVENVSLAIPAKSRVGFVGGTGAGKTSLVDVILGLLPPTSGSILADGVEVTPQNRRAWQNGIGYVGQHIVLFDDSVTRNIACGVPEDEIDPAAVEQAAKIACIHDFITTGLPHGYDTEIGENGVRLSGGQRQRIGLARALYHDPHLLILDEATSALDNLTETEIMKALETLAGKKTIIMIAHRLTTVQSCDTIYMMERGRVVASGPYDRLLAESPAFRELARKTG